MHTFAHNNRHRYAKKQQTDRPSRIHTPVHANSCERNDWHQTYASNYNPCSALGGGVSLRETSRRPNICVKNKGPSILGKGGNHTGIS